MTTAADFRQFARDCERWAGRTPNPSHRQLMLDMARMWIDIAKTVEHNIGVMDDVERVREQYRLRQLLD